MKHNTDRTNRHLYFAAGVVPLLLQTLRYSRWRCALIAQHKATVRLHLEHAVTGARLLVTVGKVKPGDHDQQRGRFAIPNRPSWLRSVYHLEQKLFAGTIPPWLRPYCTSCGRVTP